MQTLAQVGTLARVYMNLSEVYKERRQIARLQQAVPPSLSQRISSLEQTLAELGVEMPSDAEIVVLADRPRPEIKIGEPVKAVTNDTLEPLVA